MEQDELINNIKQWLKLDNEIKELNKLIKEKRFERKQFSDNLVVTMKDRGIDCFDITGGQLQFTQNKIKKPISKKHLILSLQEFFKDKQFETNNLCNYILNSREEITKEYIKRK